MRIFASGSASKNLLPKYCEGLDKLAEYLAKNDDSIIIVGTTSGSVGCLYHEMRKRKGLIDVLSPVVYKKEAEGMQDIRNMSLVDSLFTLQRLFLANSDATVVLPGGNGTLAELFMFTDLIKSKYTQNPVIIFNINGFYDDIKKYLKFLSEAGALEQFQHDFFKFCNSPEEVIVELEKYKKNI